MTKNTMTGQMMMTSSGKASNGSYLNPKNSGGANHKKKRHAAAASRVLVSGVSVSATLLMVGAMAASASQTGSQGLTEVRSDFNKSTSYDSGGSGRFVLFSPSTAPYVTQSKGS